MTTHSDEITAMLGNPANAVSNIAENKVQSKIDLKSVLESAKLRHLGFSTTAGRSGGTICSINLSEGYYIQNNEIHNRTNHPKIDFKKLAESIFATDRRICSVNFNSQTGHIKTYTR